MDALISVVRLASLLALLAACESTFPSVTCVNQYDCPDGADCDMGLCVARGCAPACAPAHVCVGTRCLAPSCGPVPCGAGAGCLGERCVDAACLEISCDGGQACAAGSCHPTRCQERVCAANAVCLGADAGLCTDVACVGVPCPAGQLCRLGLCGRP